MKKHIKIDSHTPMKGVLDFSFLLDPPAGKFGFVKAQNGHLYFDNGQRARFIGFNFPGGGMMPEHETAERYAERLASMGVNVVRLHAGDGNWQGYSIIDYSKGNSLELDPVMFDRLHYFVYQLKVKGIYVHVDLHCYRIFHEADGLDHPGGLPYAAKSITVYNKRIIDLQKDFAKKYLTCVNPYTNLAFIDDPAVMCIQITNENSIFWIGNGDVLMPEERKPYEEDLKRMFNDWLLRRYGDRDGLKKAWTRNGECALLDYEDPAQGTVEPIPLGEYCQPWIDHCAYWVGTGSPARYADYFRFGIEVTREYYSEMADYIRSLGAKVPINGNNLNSGIADIYASSDVDLCENNAYYNHPMGSRNATVFTWHENILTDPRKTTYPHFNIRDNHMIQQLAGACVSGKPFVVSEWNEYGAMPFHSPAFLMQVAYACLQDWDGLIIYSYSQYDNYKKAPDDYVKSVFDAYNDPSLICQFGLLASIFLRGMVKCARNLFEICYTKEDLLTLPENYKLPYGFLPFISRVRTVFLDGDKPKYSGNADVAVSSGFTSTGDYTEAKHAVVYSRSSYRDALQHDYAGKDFLEMHRAKDAKPYIGLGTLDKKAVVIDDTNAIERDVDHTGFSRIVDGAMKYWGLLVQGQGLAEINTFVSDTSEITFSFGKGRFTVRTENLSVFSGYPSGETVDMGEGYFAYIKNRKMSLSLLPLDGESLKNTRRLLVFAIGETGNDGNIWAGDILLGLGGKLFIDRIEGSISIHGAKSAVGWELDPYGNRMGSLKIYSDENGVTVEFGDGQAAPVFYLEIER